MSIKRVLIDYEPEGVLYKAIKSIIFKTFYGKDSELAVYRRSLTVLRQFPRVREELFAQTFDDAPFDCFIQVFTRCKYSFD